MLSGWTKYPTPVVQHPNDETTARVPPPRPPRLPSTVPKVATLDGRIPEQWRVKASDQKGFNEWFSVRTSHQHKDVNLTGAQRLTLSIIGNQQIPEGRKEHFRNRKAPLVSMADQHPHPSRTDSLVRVGVARSAKERETEAIRASITHMSKTPSTLHLSDDTALSSKPKEASERQFEEFRLAVEQQKLHILQEYQKMASPKATSERRSVDIRTGQNSHPPEILPLAIPSTPPVSSRLKRGSGSGSRIFSPGRRSEDLGTPIPPESKKPGSFTRTFKKTIEKGLGTVGSSPRGSRASIHKRQKSVDSFDTICKTLDSQEDDEFLALDEGPSLFIVSPKAKLEDGDDLEKPRSRARRRRKSFSNSSPKVTFERSNSYSNRLGSLGTESSDGIVSAPESLQAIAKPEILPLIAAEEECSIEDGEDSQNE